MHSQLRQKRYEDVLRLNLTYSLEMSIKDPLTGCYNRRYFDKHLKNEIVNAIANGSKLSLLMLDIDYFKQVNDKFGHTVGDELLKHMQSRISKQIRVTDTLVRYGGEEFAIILPDTSASEAFAVAERIRLAIVEPFELLDNVLHKSVSIGVAEVHKTDIHDNNLFIKHADQCLYRAKNNGRNQVICEFQNCFFQMPHHSQSTD